MPYCLDYDIHNKLGPKIKEKNEPRAPFITRDEIANEMGISDTQRDNIIDELFDRGHVTKNGVIGTKIRITEKGREYTRDVILG